MVAAILQRPTLVLNRSWQPVGIATVARSLIKVFQGNARIVDPADYQLYTWDQWAELAPRSGQPCIQSARLRLRVPEVISLIYYDRLPRRSVSFNRRNVFRRDRYTCQYCGIRPGSEELTIDHIVPRSQGGQTSWTNCVLACIACNKRKADRTVAQAGLRLRKTPVKPHWQPLFATSEPAVESWSRFISDAYWNVPLE